jgi:DtxR family manganese transport transcriptional regulator
MASREGTSRARRGGGKSRNAASPRQQAVGHQQEREDHRLALVHDYVQVIADLIDEEGEARIVDIAARFGVSHVTALKNVERLQREDLAETKPRRAVFLTDAGWELVKRLRHRYDVVVQFLMSLGIPEDVAHADAEGIEHHVSDETLAAFEQHVQR